ncbi:N-formylglutamate amidohydrolase [Candidatus Methylospira mobilis]|uniref:N-formylglutamate amidohydrolase n=1 Tax=Candidatus Methylospira mobilis TaxID=1808979 RepID=A0A5Q0BL68_9GAMM|nr:N-formylglutamate amidohydrolase [Candidatus Methylospira mobilis]QFY44530.1 N-formylglutamate amidohydrolase [Candidatus Methylospira mobilis]
MDKNLCGRLIVTCEHGGNSIPQAYRHLFQTDQDRRLLNSHRGFDPGALVMAESAAMQLAAPLVMSTTSRLLVDLNRSLHHLQIYAPAVRAAPAAVRRDIVENYYLPFRNEAESLIRETIAGGLRAVHLSCHSFTPILDGIERNADIGLLYHPAHHQEADFCKRWQCGIKALAPMLKVRRNYPYAGKNDGFTRYLRLCFAPCQYLGIELEINQRLVREEDEDWSDLRSILIESLRMTLNSW